MSAERTQFDETDQITRNYIMLFRASKYLTEAKKIEYVKMS